MHIKSDTQEANQGVFQGRSIGTTCEGRFKKAPDEIH